MIPVRYLRLSALLSLSLWIGAARLVSADAPAYPIGAGDVLQITIYAGGEQQESFITEVSAAGTITIPLLGQLSTDNLLPAGLSERLIQRLSEGSYYVNPHVIVTVKEYAGKVYVNGEVGRPGAYSVRDGLTVLNACILAGGFSDYAALSRVKVFRSVKGNTQLFKINLKKVQKGEQPDLLLRPGDRIEVPHRRF